MVFTSAFGPSLDLDAVSHSQQRTTGGYTIALASDLVADISHPATFCFGRIPIVRDLSRSNSLLYRQSTALRRRDMVERFRAWQDARRLGMEAPDWARRGVLFGLSTTFERPNPEWADTRDSRDDLRVPLALVKTTFARFSPETCRGLLYRGWWLSGAALSTFHREVLPPQLPVWREPLVVAG